MSIYYVAQELYDLLDPCTNDWIVLSSVNLYETYVCVSKKRQWWIPRIGVRYRRHFYNRQWFFYFECRTEDWRLLTFDRRFVRAAEFFLRSRKHLDRRTSGIFQASLQKTPSFWQMVSLFIRSLMFLVSYNASIALFYLHEYRVRRI